MTYIQGHPPWGEGLAGVIIRAVSCRQPQDEVWTIRDQGKPVGGAGGKGTPPFCSCKISRDWPRMAMGPMALPTRPGA